LDIDTNVQNLALNQSTKVPTRNKLKVVEIAVFRKYLTNYKMFR